MFREFIAAWMADTAEPAPLRAELMAAAVVAAHNHVLRRWLRGESRDPVIEVDEALHMVIGLFAASAGESGGNGTTIVAFRSRDDIEALIPVLRRLAGEQSATCPAGRYGPLMLSASPQRNATGAGSRVPVSISHAARQRPIRRGTLTEPPAPGTSPIRTSGSVK